MRKLAIIGGGPKGVSALVELDRAISQAQAPLNRIQVDLFEPHEPGPGAVWDVHAPMHLIMNVPAKIVDLSGPSFPLSYTQWALQHDNPLSREVFPPRALMGEYLRDAFQATVRSPRLKVSVQRERVEALTQAPQSSGWMVASAGGVTATSYGPYEAVLLATGHRDPLPHSWYHDVATLVSENNVRIRGAALTALDAVLSLTVGRGGRFETNSDHEQTLRYVASGAEPSTITLCSRSGVPLSPKTGPLPAPLRQVILDSTAELLEVAELSEVQPSPQWSEALVGAAKKVADFVGLSASSQELAQVLFQPDHLQAGETAANRMDRHLRMNRQELVPDAQWVWGRVWHTGYSHIIESLARRTREPEQWTRFRVAAANAERWAYGPPEFTAERLLALECDGRLRWETTGASEIETQIDAVTNGPGILDELHKRVPDPLWEGLVRASLVSIRAGERGVLTNQVAQCVGADGTLTRGLYAVGRPTEDPVIGHDTLNHRLHPDLQQWAQHLVDNATERTW